MKKYARRDFLKTAAVGTAAIAVLPSLTGLAGVARADGEDDGKRQFSFVVLMQSGTSEHRILLNGGGFFGEGGVQGRGAFTHFRATGTTPPPIVGFGTWKAKRLVGFTEVGAFGSQQGGILDLIVELRASNGTKLRNVEMKVVCNLGPSGTSTGLDEQVRLSGGDLPLTFDTHLAGLTLFSTKSPD